VADSKPTRRNGLAVRVTLADIVLAAAAANHAERVRQQALAELDALGVVDFLDLPAWASFDVAPEVAMGFFKSKGLRPSFSFADMVGAAHDQAFTVAKMMDVDMLGQVKASLDDALATGASFKAWKKDIVPLLQKGGWWGEKDVVDPATGQTARAKLGSPWRLETIFRTNMQQAYAVEAWAGVVEQAEQAPFLMYDAVDDLRTRPEHRAWDRRVLRWDHPWWKTHFPPLGYNCRCGIVQMSQGELQAMGLTAAQDVPDEGTYRWRNPRTGMPMDVPKGVDPGFDRNPGAAYVTQLERLAREKIAQIADPKTAAAAEAGMRSVARKTPLGQAAAGLADIADDVQRAGRLDKFLSSDLVDYVAAIIGGIEPTDAQAAAFAALSREDQRAVLARVEQIRGA